MPAPANDDSAAVQRAQMRKVRRNAHRNIGALPEHLPRVEQTIEPETTVCPCCAGQPARPAIERPQMVRVCVENGLKASRLPSTVETILPSGVRLVVAPDVDPGALTRIM